MTKFHPVVSTLVILTTTAALWGVIYLVAQEVAGALAMASLSLP